MALASLSDFARDLNVAPSYVTKLRQAGRLVMVGRMVDVEASRKRIRETESGARPHVIGRAHWEEQRNGTAPPPADDAAVDPEQPGDSTYSRAYWDRREAAARAEMREIELAKMKGELVSREDVDFVLNDFGAVWRGLLDNLADRLAPQVYPLDTLEETHTAIAEAAEELQREMAETMKRRIEGMGK